MSGWLPEPLVSSVRLGLCYISDAWVNRDNTLKVIMQWQWKETESSFFSAHLPGFQILFWWATLLSWKNSKLHNWSAGKKSLISFFWDCFKTLFLLTGSIVTFRITTLVTFRKHTIRNTIRPPYCPISFVDQRYNRCFILTPCWTDDRLSSFAPFVAGNYGKTEALNWG